jgi:hypothetical protein
MTLWIARLEEARSRHMHGERALVGANADRQLSRLRNPGHAGGVTAHSDLLIVNLFSILQYWLLTTILHFAISIRENDPLHR